MTQVHTIIWDEEQCAQYRATINERMASKPWMEVDETHRAFLERRHTEPLVMYRTRYTGIGYPFNMDNLKENAFQQISVIGGLEEPMAMFVIHHDFSVTREHNKDLPPQTYALFSYIDENAETLVQEMLELGILERVVAQH